MPEQTNILDSLRTAVKEEMRPMEERLENKITNFKNEILTHVDGVMHEVKSMREEQSAMIHTLTDHEKRIDRLETRVGV